jgi:hypothetical protein
MRHSLVDIIKKYEPLIVTGTMLGLSKLADNESTLLCMSLTDKTVEWNPFVSQLISRVGPNGFRAMSMSVVGGVTYLLRNGSRGITYALTAIQCGAAINNLIAYYGFLT